MVAVSLLARCAGSMAIESLLSNLNEPRNNIVRGVSVSPGVRGFFVVFGTSRSVHLRLIIALAIRVVPAIFRALCDV